MWKLLLAVPVVLYIVAAAFLYFSQTAMLFPARSVLPAEPPPTAQTVQLETPTGHSLQGVHIPPLRPGAERLLILGFGGNAWSAASAAGYLSELFPEADVVAFHYRGYAPSTGSPSGEALREDALLVHDFARRRLGEARTIAVGFSIGSGVAASLAARRPLDGAILVTPFDSLTKVAAGHYRWLPVRLLFRHPMDSAGALAGSRVPVAIIAGDRDTLIVPERTEALRRTVANLAFDRTIAGAGHNDIYDHPDFRQAMREAVSTLLRIS